MPHGHHHHHHHGHHGFGGFGHHHHHHRHHGFGPGIAAAEGLAVGAAIGTGLAVAATVAGRPRYDRWDASVAGGSPAMYPAYPVAAVNGATVTVIGAGAPVVPVAGPPPLGIAAVRIPRDSMQKSHGIQMFTIEVTPDNGGAPWQIRHRYNDFDELANRLGSRARNLMCAPFPRKHLTGCEGSKLEARRAALEMWLAQVLTYANSYDHAEWRGPLRVFLEPAVRPAAPAAAGVPVYASAPAVAGSPPGGLQNRAGQGYSPTASTAGVSAGFPGISRPLPNLAGAAPVAPAGAYVGGAVSSGSNPLPPPSGAAPGSAPTDSSLPPPSGPAPSPAPEAAPAPSDGGYVMEIEVPAGVEAGQQIGVQIPSGEQLLVKVPEGAVAGQTLSLWYENGTLQPLA